jgi:hypothetical protein
MTDVDKITLTLTLLIIVAAVAFGVVFRRLSEIERQPFLGSPAAVGPIGLCIFRRRGFRSCHTKFNSDGKVRRPSRPSWELFWRIPE